MKYPWLCCIDFATFFKLSIISVTMSAMLNWWSAILKWNMLLVATLISFLLEWIPPGAITSTNYGIKSALVLEL